MPQLFLFDEPLSNLDAQLRDEMRSEIKRLHQELGATMIYVTHDQIEAMTLADRIVLMNDGQIEQQGSPLELYERPATRFVAGFLGSPKINLHRRRLVAMAAALFRGCRRHEPAAAVADAAAAIPFAAAASIARRSGRSMSTVRPAAPAPATSGCGRSIELVQPTGSRTYVTFAARRSSR